MSAPQKDDAEAVIQNRAQENQAAPAPAAPQRNSVELLYPLESPTAFLGLIQLWFEICEYQWQTTRTDGIYFSEFLSAHREGRIRLSIIPRSDAVPTDPSGQATSSQHDSDAEENETGDHPRDPIAPPSASQEAGTNDAFLNKVHGVIRERNTLYAADTRRQEEQRAQEQVEENQAAQVLEEKAGEDVVDQADEV